MTLPVRDTVGLLARASTGGLVSVATAAEALHVSSRDAAVKLARLERAGGSPGAPQSQAPDMLRFLSMASTPPIAKSTPPTTKGTDREGAVLDRRKARARKRDALERFVAKNAKVLAKLAK